MDFSALADSITSTVTQALPYFGVLVGIIIGIPLTLKVVKRIIR